MSRILLIQPIFVPNDLGLKVQLDSIASLVNYLKEFPYDLHLCFGGWVKTQEYKDKIMEALKPLKCDIAFYAQNFGKAHIVNDCLKEWYTDEDYLFTYDSDIQFIIHEPRMFERLVKLADATDRFGLVSLAQTGADCQLHNHYTEERTTNGEVLRWAPGGGGIAGGCLFISIPVFKSLKGYRELGVYDSDDGYLMSDINRGKWFCATLETISCYHPYIEIKEGYNKWKGDILNCRRTIGGGKYEDKLKDAEEYWK